MKYVSVVIVFFWPLCGLAQAQVALTAADREWIGRCMTQLQSEHDRKAVRVYCNCMHAYFEDNEKVSQSDMEHMVPPAHRLCHTTAGWK